MLIVITGHSIGAPSTGPPQEVDEAVMYVYTILAVTENLILS